MSFCCIDQSFDNLIIWVVSQFKPDSVILFPEVEYSMRVFIYFFFLVGNSCKEALSVYSGQKSYIFRISYNNH